MELATFLTEIQWITAIDPEPEIFAENGVIYADFCAATLYPVANNPDRHPCVDVYLNGEWIQWDEVEDPLPDNEVLRFRYAVTV